MAGRCDDVSITDPWEHFSTFVGLTTGSSSSLCWLTEYPLVNKPCWIISDRILSLHS